RRDRPEHGLLRRRQPGGDPRRLRLLRTSSHCRRSTDTATVSAMKPPYLPEQQEYEPPAWQAPEDYQYNPIQPQRSWRDVLRRIWAPIAAAGAALVKYGAILFKAKFL